MAICRQSTGGFVGGGLKLLNMRKLLPAVGILACLLPGCRSTHPTQTPFAVFVPDGSAILFSAAQGSDCFLYTAEIATGRVSQFTHAQSGCEY